MANFKYSLWTIVHEDYCHVTAVKHKDTNSGKECDRWEEEDFYNVVSFYREEDELNADYLQTFSKD